MLEKKVLVITECIEMDLLSSESRLVTSVQKTLQTVQEQREHPLELDESERESPVRSRHPDQPTTPPLDPNPPGCTEEIEIEMEVFPPLRISDCELVEVQSEHSSIIRVIDSFTPKCHRVHWRRLTPQTGRLTVKDVVCLPADYDVEQSNRLQGKERMPSSVSLMARITIDRTWSAAQVESRLMAIFAGDRPRKARRCILTFLQCVPGSRVLFAPQTPTSGWTGDQILRISAFSVLYVVCHYDDQHGTPPSDTLKRIDEVL